VGNDGQYREDNIGLVDALSVGAVVGTEHVEQVSERDELPSTERDVRQTFAASGLAVDASLEVRGRPSDSKEGCRFFDGQEGGKVLRKR
jgi:hypothetical protein